MKSMEIEVDDLLTTIGRNVEAIRAKLLITNRLADTKRIDALKNIGEDINIILMALGKVEDLLWDEIYGEPEEDEPISSGYSKVE